MSDYIVGRSKPPIEHQFKPGISGNPKGRPRKKRSIDLATIVIDALNAPIEYQDGERTKVASGRTLNVMMTVKRAVRGDIGAALAVLELRNQAVQRVTADAARIEIYDWPPDFPGQTAEQKTRAYHEKKGAVTSEWWSDPKSSEVKPKLREKIDS